jgi:hypothetical protein
VNLSKVLEVRTAVPILQGRKLRLPSVFGKMKHFEVWPTGGSFSSRSSTKYQDDKPGS